MTVTAPPRPPRGSDPVSRQEVEALVDALFEEARQRARRRRRIRMAMVACLAIVVVAVLAVFERSAESQSSSPSAAARPGFTSGKVRVVIAGTNDRFPPPGDGSLVGKGTFRASGAMTDTGTVRAYRTVSRNGTLIALRFVTKGKKGTITYLVKIDTTAGTSQWTIVSATEAYRGLRGKGTESENGDYSVSTLRGTVSG